MNRAVIHDPENGSLAAIPAPPCRPYGRKPLRHPAASRRGGSACLRRDGLYAAGWIGYEAAPAFDPAFRTRPATAFPLACFGIFGPPTLLKALPAAGQSFRRDTWRPTVNRDEYAAAIARIKDHIALG